MNFTKNKKTDALILGSIVIVVKLIYYLVYNYLSEYYYFLMIIFIGVVFSAAFIEIRKSNRNKLIGLPEHDEMSIHLDKQTSQKTLGLSFIYWTFLVFEGIGRFELNRALVLSALILSAISYLIIRLYYKENPIEDSHSGFFSNK
jgi:heme O synthase-like polyprenyltransferase